MDVVLDDGTIIKCKIADIKDIDDDNYTKYGHISAPDNTTPAIDVVEWELAGSEKDLDIEDWNYRKVERVLKDIYKG